MAALDQEPTDIESLLREQYEDHTLGSKKTLVSFPDTDVRTTVVVSRYPETGILGILFTEMPDLGVVQVENQPLSISLKRICVQDVDGRRTVQILHWSTLSMGKGALPESLQHLAQDPSTPEELARVEERKFRNAAQELGFRLHLLPHQVV